MSENFIFKKYNNPRYETQMQHICKYLYYKEFAHLYAIVRKQEGKYSKLHIV